MIEEVKKAFDELKERLESAIAYLTKEFNTLKTGRASPTLVEDLRVEYYGSILPLKQLAAISVPDPKMLVIQPYDKSAVKAIEKAILTSPLGITPQVNGSIIRLVIPKLTEERRKELIKVVSHKAEEVRISMRQARRDAIETVKKLQKDGLISEDERERYIKEIEKVFRDYIAKVDKLLKLKEEEILTV